VCHRSGHKIRSTVADRAHLEEHKQSRRRERRGASLLRMPQILRRAMRVFEPSDPDRQRTSSVSGDSDGRRRFRWSASLGGLPPRGRWKPSYTPGPESSRSNKAIITASVRDSGDHQARATSFASSLTLTACCPPVTCFRHDRRQRRARSMVAHMLPEHPPAARSRTSVCLGQLGRR